MEASRGELARAAKLFKAAVALEPGRPNVRTALINLLVASARLADAAAACEPLLAANPADPLAHRVIGLDHATSGRTKLAERHLRRALQTERHPDALRALATLLDAKGARDEAARLRSELR